MEEVKEVSANPSSQTTTKGKNVKKKSKVWDHYTLVDGGDPNYPKAFCNYCGKTYGTRGKQDGTCNLWSYFNNQCTKYPFKVVDKKKKTLCFIKGEEKEKEEDGVALKAVGYTEKVCRDALAKMIIVDELSFSHVEKEGFENFCQAMQPKFTIPSRITVARDCLRIVNEAKVKLKKAIRKQRICLTTDTWTSIQNINHMCLTAYWIDDDWNLHKRILNFLQVPNHKGETIGKHIEKCLLEWGIDKILTITVDNKSRGASLQSCSQEEEEEEEEKENSKNKLEK